MLEKIKYINKYKLGIIAPRSFDNPTLLSALISPNLKSISMILTNNVKSGGEVVRKYAETTLVPYTIYPVTPQVGGTLISNSLIVQNADFIYVLDDGKSDNVKNVQEECKKRGKKHKVVQFKINIPET